MDKTRSSAAVITRTGDQWRLRCSQWVPGRRFVDRQVRGPFRRWYHVHEFETDGAGTLIVDTVDFDLYCRPLFHTPALGWIESDLRSIFDHRHREIATVFGQSG